MDYLDMAESFYRTLDLYLWLATRYPKIFLEREKVMEKREFCSKLVNRLLGRITVDGAKPLPDLFTDRMQKKMEGAVQRGSSDKPKSDIKELERALQDLDDKSR
jgi:hypothetical protein